MGVPAGSLSDTYTRKLYDHVSKITGDTFVVINKPGADQLIAYQQFIEESKTNPNVIYSSGTSSLVASYALHSELKLKPLTDTQSLFTVLRVHYYIVARTDSPVNSFKDIKGKLNVGSSNATSTTLFNTANFDKQVQMIPFKGDNDLILSLLQREIDLASVISINPLLQTNKDKIKIVGNFNPVVGAVGYSIPNNFSADHAQSINRALNQVVQHPDIKQWFVTTMGSAPVGGSPADYNAILLNFKKQLSITTK